MLCYVDVNSLRFVEDVEKGKKKMKIVGWLKLISAAQLKEYGKGESTIFQGKISYFSLVWLTQRGLKKTMITLKTIFSHSKFVFWRVGRFVQFNGQRISQKINNFCFGNGLVLLNHRDIAWTMSSCCMASMGHNELTFQIAGDLWSFNPLCINPCSEFILGHTNIYSFFLISHHWDGAGGENASLWRTETRLSCGVNPIAADDLAPKVARSSAAMVLIFLSWNILVSFPFIC